MQLLLEMATFVVLCTCSIYMIFGTYSECLKITQKSFGEVSLRSQCCKKPLFGGDFQVLCLLKLYTRKEEDKVICIIQDLFKSNLPPCFFTSPDVPDERSSKCSLPFLACFMPEIDGVGCRHFAPDSAISEHVVVISQAASLNDYDEEAHLCRRYPCG